MHPSVPSFLQYLAVEKRFSDHTLKAYSTDLEQYAIWLNSRFEEEDPLCATAVMIRDWVVSLRESGVEPRSVNRKLSSLRSYYRYSQSEGSIPINPMTGIRSLKTPRRIVRAVDSVDMESLLSPDLYAGEHAWRDRMIILTLYMTGLRRAELVSLRWKDIDFARKQLRVTGKRNVERLIPLMDRYLEELQSYRQSGFDALPDQHDFVFSGKEKHSLDPKVVYKVVVHYLSQVSSIEKKSPHVLRHTFATHLLNMGADLQAIKELLGHASLAATQVYTHNSIEQIKSVYQRSHPRSKK